MKTNENTIHPFSLSIAPAEMVGGGNAFLQDKIAESVTFATGWNAAVRFMRERPDPVQLPLPIDVIFHNPATIVYWNDGTKTVVKCQPGDVFSAETGLMAAMLKRFMGNDNTYNKVINFWLDAAAAELPEATE